MDARFWYYRNKIQKQEQLRLAQTKPYYVLWQEGMHPNNQFPSGDITSVKPPDGNWGAEYTVAASYADAIEIQSEGQLARQQHFQEMYSAYIE